MKCKICGRPGFFHVSDTAVRGICPECRKLPALHAEGRYPRGEKDQCPSCGGHEVRKASEVECIRAGIRGVEWNARDRFPARPRICETCSTIWVPFVSKRKAQRLREIWKTTGILLQVVAFLMLLLCFPSKAVYLSLSSLSA